MSQDVEKLLRIIEQKLDWGGSTEWQSKDFENLNQFILDETGVSLSASTLRRIWGRVEYHHLPSTTTLDTLAKFAGFENWRKFARQQGPIESVQNKSVQESKSRRGPSISFSKISWIVMIVIAISVLSIFAVEKSRHSIRPTDYSFSSKPLTRGLPNTVIFTYDASLAPDDSIFIQQSWDMRTKTLVDKRSHQQTSVYYEPGFYRAKLFVGKEVVKEHPLIISTNGWLGTIDHQPVPVYLDSNQFIHEDRMDLAVSEIIKKNMPLQPQPPLVKYSNVGNFDPVPVSRFSFSCEMKNEYHEGAAACQLSEIILMTDGNPIIITLSVKGCVSELYLMSVDHEASGKKSDLSGFGVDFSKWAQVSCKTDSGKIQYYVNEKLAYEFPLPAKEVQIVGMSFIFQGTGAVKNIRLGDHDKLIFHAF